jgi:drug/metabolite transporter (DMT)-like permease
MTRKKLATNGSLFIFFYVIASAISNVFVNHTNRSISPIVTLFYSSIFTIIFFSILNFGELTKNISLIKENKKSILWLNFLNAIIWFIIFYSLKILSPAVFSCLFLGAIPINLFILELKNSKESKKNNLIIAILLFAIFILMLLLVSKDMSETNTSQVLKYGALVTVIGGVSAAFIMKISKKLADKNLPASLVVSLRFYGLLIISLIIIILNKPQLQLKPIILLELLALALVSMALPLYLLQKALKTFNPLYASIIITVIPILTYLFQILTGYYSFSNSKFGITILLSISLIVLTYLKRKKQTK